MGKGDPPIGVSVVVKVARSFADPASLTAPNWEAVRLRPALVPSLWLHKVGILGCKVAQLTGTR